MVIIRTSLPNNRPSSLLEYPIEFFPKNLPGILRRRERRQHRWSQRAAAALGRMICERSDMMLTMLTLRHELYDMCRHINDTIHDRYTIHIY